LNKIFDDNNIKILILEDEDKHIATNNGVTINSGLNIQTAGRVNRHRKIDYSDRKPNVFLMNENYMLQNQYESYEKYPVYIFPGYESKDNIFKENDKRDLFSLTKENDVVIDFSPFDILTPKCPMSRKGTKTIKEHFDKYMSVFNQTSAKFSYLEYDINNINESKKDMFGVFTKFRDSNKDHPYVFKYENEKLYSLQGKKFSPHQGRESNANEYVEDYDFDFIDIDFSKYVKELEKHMNYDSLWTVRMNSSKVIKGCFYNEFLGVVKKS